MSWSTPVIHATGDVVIASDWNIGSNDLTFLFQKPYAKVYDNTGLALSNGSDGQLVLAGTDVLGYGMALTSGNVVVPVAGVYLAIGQIGLGVATNSVTVFSCYLAKNGTKTWGFAENGVTYVSGSFAKRTETALVVCAAGDTIGLWGQAASTTTQHSTSGVGSTFLHVTWLGSS